MENFLNSSDLVVNFSLNEISLVIKQKFCILKNRFGFFSVSFDKAINADFHIEKQEFYSLIQKLKEKELKNFCLKRRFSNLTLKERIPFIKKTSIIYFLMLSFSIFFFFDSFISILFTFFMFFLAIKLLVIIKSIYFFKENKKDTVCLKKRNQKYSILVALYKEEKVLKQIIKSLKSLSYPKDAIEYLIIVEADDLHLKMALNEVDLDDRFVVIEVPVFKPRTKPKALNYAINFITGDYVCVYDAEDIPDKNQLFLAKKSFQSSDSDVLQSVLSFYNYKQNFLTLCFNFEYVSWFYFLFAGYSSLDFNCPLGGTSNHIKKEALIRAGYWNSFNVTEDLELSVVLSRIGFKIRSLNSFTQEQCVYKLKDWFRQRKRWMKGYYISYFENFFTFSIFDIKNFIYFHGIVGFSATGFLLLPFLYFYTMFFFHGSFFLKNMYLLSFLSKAFTAIFFFACIGFPLILVSIKLKITNIMNILKILIVYPSYFILHFFCSFVALVEAVKKPDFWDKTNHDLLKIVDNSLEVNHKKIE